MPLRKYSQPGREASPGKVEVTKSKRQKIVDFFMSRKRRQDEGNDAVPIPTPVDKAAPQKAARDSKIAESTKPAKSSSSVQVVKTRSQKTKEKQLPRSSQEPAPAPAPTPAPAPAPGPKDKDKTQALSEEHVHALFSGAPHFTIDRTEDRSSPKATYPWNEELAVKDVSDSVQLAQPAFSAATLHPHLPNLQQSGDQEKKYHGYDLDVFEVPNMLSAQGIEPGTVGFVHFLELSQPDSLVTDLQQSQSSNGYLEAVRNKEQMQTDPERLGIRRVDMTMVHDRLVEFGDLFEAFQDSPARMTILNNQSSGDLYANLFGKFLTPPRYDGSTDDPTGIKVQIDTLLKVLRLAGVWYDFSLVEWRIRLGQILWSDTDGLAENESDQLWTEREILLLQITLACELLLRLDAVSSMEPGDVKAQMHVSPDDFRGFLDLKTRKTAWDMVLARRFLENILVIKEDDTDASAQTPKSRGLLSMLSRDESKVSPRADVILLPRHQARQLSGLLYFAENVQWPGIDMIVKDLAQKLGVPDGTNQPEQQTSPYGKFSDPSTPSNISVYGTPLTTSRSPNGVPDCYFGQMTKPALSQNNSRSLTIPLSTTLLAHVGGSAAATTFNVGGWLSRSYLTGLVLPGEGISHFLMSTLLENDTLAIAALGDSANLYGGFIYTDRSWWSKSSIVSRVLACIEGAAECMGWICITKPLESLPNGWYALSSDQIQLEQPARITAEEDLVARDSTPILGDEDNHLKPEDLVLPLDPSTPPIPSVGFRGWSLTSIASEASDHEGLSGSPSETETHTASLTFTSFARGTTHTFTLTYDAQFVTSFPCTPPASSPVINLPKVLKRSLSLSRSSSKRSIPSTQNSSVRLSRHPSRRNSHGFEPLLSHPPDSPSIAPIPVRSSVPDEETEEKSGSNTASPVSEPMMVHPLHVSYKYKIVPVTEILDPNFILPFTMHASTSPVPSLGDETAEPKAEEKVVLILDARASRELELLARAWCAEKGLHAIIGRVRRTCLACCVREARGLGVSVVIRV